MCDGVEPEAVFNVEFVTAPVFVEVAKSDSESFAIFFFFSFLFSPFVGESVAAEVVSPDGPFPVLSTEDCVPLGEELVLLHALLDRETPVIFGGLDFGSTDLTAGRAETVLELKIATRGLLPVLTDCTTPTVTGMIGFADCATITGLVV